MSNRHKARDMTVGTKSLLFGVHQFLWHPLVVARAWRLWYGRWPKLWEWVVIIVHDWGYWGCQDMDGPHGLPHPVAGARIARGVLFLYPRRTRQEAFKLALGHSSHFSRIARMPQSALCIPDKLSMLFEPWWFYRLRATASGELSGYVANGPAGQTPVQWFRWLQGHFREKYGLLNSVSQNPGVRLRASMGR